MSRTYTAVSPSFFSGDALAYQGMAKKFGKRDYDPDQGGYQLHHIHWNDETGVASFSTTDALPGGWMALTPQKPCHCEDGTQPCHCP